jgi:hypothetical protein
MTQALPEAVRTVDTTLHAGRGVTLMPLSCVYWPNAHMESLRAWRKAVRSTRNAKVVLDGNLLDVERYDPPRTKSRAYPALDKWCAEQVRGLAAFLAPIKDKILVSVQADRAHVFADGATSDYRLMDELGIADRYRPGFSIVNAGFADGSAAIIAVISKRGHRGVNSEGMWKRATGADVVILRSESRRPEPITIRRIELNGGPR